MPEAIWEEWESGLARKLDGAREILRRNWRRSVDGQASDSAIKEVRFKGRSYPVVAALGGNMESKVYLVKDGSGEAVLKVFHRVSRWGFGTYSMNVKALGILAEKGAPVVRLLDADAAAEIAKLSFERGYVRQGVRALYDKKIIDEDQFLAFNYFSSLHRITYTDRYSSSINPFLNPVYFNPMEENVLYDPWNSRWIILDPF